MGAPPAHAPRWRVLIVDDSRDDAELATIALRDEAGLDVATLRVDSAPALAEALDGFAPHLVLSGLNLPGFSGGEALALVRRRTPGLPVVLLTGALPDDEPVPPADALALKDEPRRMAEVVRSLLSKGRTGAA